VGGAVSGDELGLFHKIAVNPLLTTVPRVEKGRQAEQISGEKFFGQEQ